MMDNIDALQLKTHNFKHKEFQNEKVSVVFFLDKGLKRSQQIFSDLNKHAVKPYKIIRVTI